MLRYILGVAVLTSIVSGYALDTKVSKSCKLCEDAVTEFKVLYQDRKTQSLISLAVKEICSAIPIEQCEDYLQRMLTRFSANVLDMDPHDTCASIGLCKTALPVHPHLGNSIQCDFCEFVGDEIEKRILNQGNIDKVVDALEQVCRYTGPFQRVCKDFIHTELEDFLGKIVDLVDFDSLCKTARLCSSDMQKATVIFKKALAAYDAFQDDEGCRACTDGLGIVEEILKSSELQDLVHLGVHELCQVAMADEKDAVICENVTVGIVDKIMGNLIPLFDARSLCQHAGACPSLFVSISDAEGCKACLDGLELVQMILTSDEIIDLVNIAINETCMAIGGDVATCEAVTSNIIDNILKNLIVMFDPQSLCQQAGACPAVFQKFHLERSTDRGCAACKGAASLLRLVLEANQTKELVGMGIDATCEAIGGKVSFCKSFIRVVFNTAYNFYMEHFDENKICGRVCPAVKAVKSDEGCEACMDGLKIVQMLLTDPELLDLVHVAVNETCMAIGGNIATCEYAIDSILDPLIENLVKLFDPRSLCQQAGACPALMIAPNVTDGCRACLDLARLVGSVIESHNFRDLIHRAVHEVCAMGGGSADSCALILDDIIDPIIDGLLPLWDPVGICYNNPEICSAEQMVF